MQYYGSTWGDHQTYILTHFSFNIHNKEDVGGDTVEVYMDEDYLDDLPCLDQSSESPFHFPHAGLGDAESFDALTVNPSHVLLAVARLP